ncbi:MAG: beta-propeller fold lactonase family protein [Acidobacteriaceae bacterium]
MLPAHRRAKLRSPATHACALLLLSSLALLLTGCGNFFTCEGKASCPTTTCTTNCPATTTDYAYIANSSSGTTYVDGYDVGSGALTAATSAPFSFSYSPSALAITPANTFLYAATDSALTTGIIYGYSIGTGGALSILSFNSTTALVNESVSSMAISPDGQWLFCLDTDGITLEEYSINATTGALKFAATYGITGATTGVITPASVAIAPTGDYVVVALGTGGAETFGFDTTTGVATVSTLIKPANSATGIYAVAVDANDYLYAAGTAGLQVFATTAAGVPTVPGNTYTTGTGPRSIAINPDSTFVYVGNQTDGTITAYTIGTNAALTAVSGSPFTGPTTVSSLGVDSTGAYLVSSGYNSTTGINLYAIGTTGVLTNKATAATGTSALIPTPIAMTH